MLEMHLQDLTYVGFRLCHLAMPLPVRFFHSRSLTPVLFYRSPRTVGRSEQYLFNIFSSVVVALVLSSFTLNQILEDFKIQ